MNETQPAKRQPWQLQLHLSTAIVLFLELGALIPINLARYHYVMDDHPVQLFVNEQRMSAANTIFATLLLNALVLAPTAFILEWLIRYHEKRKAMGELEKPKRRLLQFHLSTALVLMLTSSILLLINVTKQEVSNPAAELEWTYGWPQVAYQGVRDDVVLDEMVTIGYDDSGPVRTVGDKRPPRQPRPIQVPRIRQDILPSWNRTGLATDLFVALLVLSVVAFVLEWLTRRREGQA